MRKTIIIGIAGGTASGKSTFSEELTKSLWELNVLEIHMDSYFKALEERPYVMAPVTGKICRDGSSPQTCNLPDLKRDLATAAGSGQYQVIVVEGLLTLWDSEIYNQLDLRLFVDCLPDERIVRRLKRNTERGQPFDDIAEVYLDLGRYRHDEYIEPTKWRADFIVNGSRCFSKVLDVVTLYIRSLIGEESG